MISIKHPTTSHASYLYLYLSHGNLNPLNPAATSSFFAGGFFLGSGFAGPFFTTALTGAVFPLVAGAAASSSLVVQTTFSYPRPPWLILPCPSRQGTPTIRNMTKTSILKRRLVRRLGRHWTPWRMRVMRGWPSSSCIVWDRMRGRIWDLSRFECFDFYSSRLGQPHTLSATTKVHGILMLLRLC